MHTTRTLRGRAPGPKSPLAMGVDVFDIVAIILGVLFTVRKLDAQRRTPQEFPHVKPAEFATWQKEEVGTYGMGMIACFSKVVVDFLFTFLLSEGLPIPTVRAVGATIDLSWLAVVLFTFYRGIRLAKRRAELRIVLGGFIVESGSELSTELKAALRFLKDGDTDRAIYELKQITLDVDDSLKAIAIYWLGEAYLRKGDTDAARDAFLESLEIDPSLAQPQEALAKLK